MQELSENTSFQLNFVLWRTKMFKNEQTKKVFWFEIELANAFGEVRFA
jgi:hypothetical protein